jgi:hypothetical protein
MLVSPRAVPDFSLGLIFGTIFQQTLLASAWVALGPGPIDSRIRWSLAWIAVLATAFGVPLLATPGRGAVLAVVASLGGLWLFGQIPFWASTWMFRLHIQHQDEMTTEAFGRGQFGIRQLMLFTAAIGLLLGIGRVVVSIDFLGARYLQYFLVNLLLLTAQVVMSVPLIYASLLRRFAVPSILIAIVFMVILTLGEIEVANQILGGGVKRKSIYWCNAIGALWTLVFAICLRSCGYRLGVA